MVSESSIPAAKRIKLDEQPEPAIGHAAQGAQVKIDATVPVLEPETRETAPEVFIKLHASWNGHSREVVLGESDRYATICMRALPARISNHLLCSTIFLCAPGFMI